MSIDTGKVTNRRKLRFSSYEEILKEVERLVAAPRVRSLGNWTLGQTLQHLATAMHMMIDGAPYQVSLINRLFARLLRNRMLHGSMPAGFKLSGEAEKHLVASSTVTTQEGLRTLRNALERVRTNTKRAAHPAFGTMTNEQWDALHFRHAELHLSFLEPDA